jgi:Rrf2 family iron-sulfur cluster assembly transcriptional regulator
MLVTQRVKHSLEVVYFLATNADKAPLTTKAFSKVTGLSTSYLEVLCSQLRRAGIIDSIRGPGGGYVLSKSAEEIHVLEIARAVGFEKAEVGWSELMAIASKEAEPANALFERASFELRSFMQHTRLSELLVQTDSAPRLAETPSPSLQRESEHLTSSLD